MTDRPSYIPPVLDPRRAGPTRADPPPPGPSEGHFNCVGRYVLHRRPTPPTVRPVADPCAEFERLIRQEGEGYARLVNVAGAMGVRK